MARLVIGAGPNRTGEEINRAARATLGALGEPGIDRLRGFTSFFRGDARRWRLSSWFAK